MPPGECYTGFRYDAVAQGHQAFLESDQMLRSMFAVAALVSLAAVPASAASCRNGKGKFVKCPEKVSAKPVKCKDARGKFAKCGIPGAKPV